MGPNRRDATGQNQTQDCEFSHLCRVGSLNFFRRSPYRSANATEAVSATGC